MTGGQSTFRGRQPIFFPFLFLVAILVVGKPPFSNRSGLVTLPLQSVVVSGRARRHSTRSVSNASISNLAELESAALSSRYAENFDRGKERSRPPSFNFCALQGGLRSINRSGPTLFVRIRTDLILELDPRKGPRSRLTASDLSSHPSPFFCVHLGRLLKVPLTPPDPKQSACDARVLSLDEVHESAT